MKITDYSKIAAKYDNNHLRHDIRKDENIGKLVQTANSDISVLDLACGTGNYLVKQIESYPEDDISWFGIDKSPEMLNVARQKRLKATLMEGDACDIPLADESMDYVKIRFAFHHFVNKKKAIDEVRRISKNHGAVSIYNLSHDYMHYSWVYRYYPQVEGYDRDRFPTSREMFQWFEEAGFETRVNIRTIMKKFKYTDIILETENRDMSQLNLITDEEYETGLSKMRRDAEHDEYLVGDISFLDLYARKIA